MRFTKYPQLPIVDQGYRVPANLFYEELDYKRKAQEQASDDLDKISAFTFQYDEKDKVAAAKVQEGIKNRTEELAQLFYTDPAKAKIELAKEKRSLARRSLNTGEDINAFTTAKAGWEARRKSVDDLGENKQPIDEYINYTKQRQGWTGTTQDPATGKWSPNLNLSGIVDHPDVGKIVDDYLTKMEKDSGTTFNRQYDPEMGKWVIEETNLSTKTKEDILAQLNYLTTQDPTVAPYMSGFAEYHALQNPNKVAQLQSDDLLATQAEIENTKVLLQDPNLTESEKDVLNKTLVELAKKGAEIPNQTLEYAHKDFVSGLISFGMAGHQKEEIDKSRQYIDALDSDGSGSGSNPKFTTSGISTTITNARVSPEIDLSTYQQDIKTTQDKLKIDQQLIDKTNTSFANIFGFQNAQYNTTKTGIPGLDGIAMYYPDDKAVEATMNLMPEINKIIANDNLSKEEKIAGIEFQINEERKNIGGSPTDPTTQQRYAVDDPKADFKFSDNFTYDQFEDQYLTYADKLNNLQTEQEAYHRKTNQMENLAKATTEDESLMSAIAYDKQYNIAGGTGVQKEPEDQVRQNMWKRYFNIDESNYNQFLIDNKDRWQELEQVNKELVEQGLAEQLPANYNTDYSKKMMMHGLTGRVKHFTKNVESHAKSHPELMDELSEIVVPTKGYGKDTEDAVKVFDNTVGTMFKELGFLRTLRTPNGKSIEEFIQKDMDLGGFDIDYVKPESIHVYPVLTPYGKTPTVFVSFDTDKLPSGTKTNVEGVEVALTENPTGVNEKAIMDNLEIFANRLLSSNDPNLQGAAKTFLGHQAFAPGVYENNIGITPNPKQKNGESTPIQVGEIAGHSVELSKNYKGQFQIYIDGEATYDQQITRPKDIMQVYTKLGDLVYQYQQLPGSSVFSTTEKLLANNISIPESGGDYSATNNSALGKYQFVYSKHEDKIRKNLEKATLVPYYTQKDKFTQEDVQKQFLLHPKAQDFTMKDWITEITPTVKSMKAMLPTDSQFTEQDLYYIVHREGQKNAVKWLKTYLATGKDSYTTSTDSPNRPILESLNQIRLYGN